MFKQLWNKLKSISYDWLPLAGITTMLYMIQRGFAGIAKAGVVDIDLALGMKIFFTAVAFSALAIGFLSDRIKVAWLLAAATVAGTIGIASGADNIWLFGIGAGIAAAAVKLLAYTAPLKNKDSGIDSLRIAPQAAAKNLGAGLFFIAIGAVLKTFGFSTFISAAAAVFATFGAWATYTCRNHTYKLLKFNMADMKALFNSAKFYTYLMWYASVTVLMYNIAPKIIPSLMHMGMVKKEAIMMYGIASLLLVPLRWLTAWFGVAVGYFNAMLVLIAMHIVNFFLILKPHPEIGIPLFFLTTAIATPNMWACAKDWFGTRIGTAMGLTMIVSYIAAGLTFGKW